MESTLNKESEAFRTISEVAEELDVPKHVLRFWEVKFPQIRPMKRGGGRRYYRPEDLELLRGIRHLLHAEGYTIKGVQKILREQGIDQVKRSWRERSVKAAKSSSGKPATPAPSSRNARRADGRLAAVPLTRRQKIEQVLAELEACRTLLKGPPAAPRRMRRPTASG